jgi:hypothetical protein
MSVLFDSLVVRGFIAVLCAVSAGQACAQPQTEVVPEISALAPPVNHESGTISEVITVRDAGYRQMGYVVGWRDSQIFVAGSPNLPHRVGESLDFTVYRVVTGGRKILRFAADQSQSDASSERDEAESSHASVTSGRAPVENTLVAENDGYRFAAYQVMWHGMRVVVVDPLQKTVYQIGDPINFRVLRSGAEEARLLTFTLSE